MGWRLSTSGKQESSDLIQHHVDVLECPLTALVQAHLGGNEACMAGSALAG